MILIPDTEAAREFDYLTNLIPTGKGNAIPMTELAAILHTEIKALKEIVLAARMDGILICSGQGGYYFPESSSELREYFRRRRRYIKTAAAAFAPFEIAILAEGKGG